MMESWGEMGDFGAAIRTSQLTERGKLNDCDLCLRLWTVELMLQRG